MKRKYIVNFIKLNTTSILVSIGFIFSLAISCGENSFLPFLFIALIILFITYLIKYFFSLNNKEQDFEKEFAYELAIGLSCGFNLEQTYFQASRVMQKYEKNIFTLDEIRLDPTVLNEYSFKTYKEEICSILCEDDFFYYTKGKYSLFIDRILALRSNDRNKRYRLKVCRRSFLIAEIITSFIVILISIINDPLEEKSFLLLIPVSLISIFVAFFEVLYEKFCD